MHRKTLALTQRRKGKVVGSVAVEAPFSFRVRSLIHGRMSPPMFAQRFKAAKQPDKSRRHTVATGVTIQPVSAVDSKQKHRCLTSLIDQVLI